MNRIPFVRLALLLGAVTATGCSLSIATVSAPDVNCRFATDCTLEVDDTVGAIPVPAASGEGRLQSRTSPVGEPGTPGAGLRPYEYRVDLTPVGGLTALVCVKSLSLDFGPITRLDYDQDGDLDHVYVVTSGGLGTVGLQSAKRNGDRVTFRFEPGLCPGNAPGNGVTSYFFGLASPDPPHPVSATIEFNAGPPVTVDARAPS